MIGEKTKDVENFWQEARRKHQIATNDYHACTLGHPDAFDPDVPSLDLSDQPRLIGKNQKRGTAHLAREFEANRIPRRKVGDYWIILDYDNAPLFLVQVTEVEVTPFNKVTETWAAVEGEGDSSLAWWADAHYEYYTRQCKPLGITWRDDLPVVCETWKVIEPAERGRAAMNAKPR
ncbi:MAG: ASCH domain-containing protein [Dongiaceae bacterium]